MIFILASIACLLGAFAIYVNGVDGVVVGIAAKAPVLLAVLIAAVFVRLARGLPTLPYDKMKSSNTSDALNAFKALIKSYVFTFAVFISAIVANLFFAEFSNNKIDGVVANFSRFLVIFLNLQSLVCLVFLVKSDYDLAIIQANIIEELDQKSAVEKSKKDRDSVREALRIVSEPPQ